LRSDVIVVGCGPAGSLASLEAARKGVEVLVLEEHKVVGEPDHCAGLVSVSGLKKLGLRVPEECVLNEVYGARFFSPSGIDFTVRRGTPQAFVLDRRAFDKWLASLAHDSGAHIVLGERATSLRVKAGEATVTVKGEWEARGKVVVDAEGCRGKIARLAGLPRPGRRVPAVQYEVTGVDVDRDFVELHFERALAPGFFAWVIPTKDGARIGLGAISQPRKRLEAFMRKRGFSCARIIRRTAGTIITGGPVRRTYASHVVTVGDAAGQVKQTTGGGVVVGGLCAKIAGQVVADAILRDDVSRLVKYQQLWKKILGKEFFYMGLARKFLDKISDRGLDGLFRAIREQGGVEILESYGDMDFEAVALKKLLASPRTLLTAITYMLT